MKVSKIISHYMQAHGETKIVSVERTRSAAKNLTQGLGRYEHTRLSPALLRSYRQREGLAPASVNRELAVLRASLKLAVLDGLIRSAPEVTRREGAGSRVSSLLPEQWERLIAEALRYPGCADFIRLTLTTGQRLQAILGLRWAQIDRAAGVIWFSRHDLGLAKRRKGRGNVPISPELGALLDRLKENATSPFVLVSRYGCRYKDINRDHWKAIVTAAGLPDLVPHDLRHTVATSLIQEGYSLLDVSKLLGHANTKITEKIYVDYQPKFLAPAAGFLGQRLGRAQ